MRNLIATSAAMLLALPVASQMLPDGTQYSKNPKTQAVVPTNVGAPQGDGIVHPPTLTRVNGGGSQGPLWHCFSANMKATAGTTGGNTNQFSVGSWVAGAGTTVTGARIRTSGAGTFVARLYTADAAGKPIAAGLSTATIKVAAAYKNYTGKFTSAIPLKQGTRYTLVIGRTAGTSGLPFGTAPATLTKVTHYWKSPTGSTWSGPWTTQNWTTATLCTYATCPAENMTSTATIGNNTNTNEFCTPFTANGRNINGITIRTSSASTGVRQVGVWLADATGKPVRQIRVGKVTVKGAALANYKLSFAPFATTAGQKYCVYSSLFSGDAALPAGTTGTKLVHYWRPKSPANGAWKGPFTSHAWSYTVHCGGHVSMRYRVAPQPQTKTEGSSFTNYPFGYYKMRYQQNHTDLGVGHKSISQQAWRRDGLTTATYGTKRTVECELTLCSTGNRAMSITYADNLKGNAAVVFKKKNFNCADWVTAPTTPPAPFNTVMKYDRPFVHTGGSLIWELMVSKEHTPGAGYPTDYQSYSTYNYKAGVVLGKGCPTTNRAAGSNLYGTSYGYNAPKMQFRLYNYMYGAIDQAAVCLYGDKNPNTALPICSVSKLYTNAWVSIPAATKTSTSGYVNFGLNNYIPYVKAAVGLKIYAQAATTDPVAKPIPVNVTNGVEMEFVAPPPNVKPKAQRVYTINIDPTNPPAAGTRVQDGGTIVQFGAIW